MKHTKEEQRFTDYREEMERINKEEEPIRQIEELEDEEKTTLPLLKHEKLHDALMWVQDKLERSMLDFVVLGEIARQIKEEDVPLLSADRVHIGILKKDLTESGLSMLKTVIKGLQVDKRQLGYEYKDVPIIIDIIEGDYDCFHYPDSHFYYTADLKLPNPFDKYWEMRDNIV